MAKVDDQKRQSVINSYVKGNKVKDILSEHKIARATFYSIKKDYDKQNKNHTNNDKIKNKGDHNHGSKNTKKVLKKIIAEREEHYNECADIRIDSSAQNIEQTIERAGTKAGNKGAEAAAAAERAALPHHRRLGIRCHRGVR